MMSKFAIRNQEGSLSVWLDKEKLNRMTRENAVLWDKNDATDELRMRERDKALRNDIR